MLKRTRLVLLAVVIGGVVVTMVKATPIVGLLFGNILSSGATKDEIIQHVRVPLPPGGSGKDGDGDKDDVWTAKLLTSGPTDVIVQDVEYVPGGHTGWHSHPGVLVSSVTAGSIEWFDSQCVKHVYNVGDALTESTEPHFVRNVGTVNARFMVTYIIAHGQPRRIDQPAPACAAGLGLE
jgi:quercetin dioxygenase-like cupin family protein